MKVVGIVQARMGSNRFPGKTMADVMGKPMLERLIDRVKRCQTLDAIVVATTKKEEDDTIVALAEKCGIDYFRGAVEDVLHRYVKAAERFKADTVVRICADNPLTDPYEVDKVVSYHLNTKADYTYNHLTHSKGLPDGTGAEVISIKALRKVDKLATEQAHREHVTKFVLDHPELFRIERLDAEPELQRPDLKLDVDYKEDLEFIREIYHRLYKPGEIIKLRAVIDLLDKNPVLLKIRQSS